MGRKVIYVDAETADKLDQLSKYLHRTKPKDKRILYKGEFNHSYILSLLIQSAYESVMEKKRKSHAKGTPDSLLRE